MGSLSVSIYTLGTPFIVLVNSSLYSVNKLVLFTVRVGGCKGYSILLFEMVKSLYYIYFYLVTVPHFLLGKSVCVGVKDSFIPLISLKTRPLSY